jgi:hypothetical protein
MIPWTNDSLATQPPGLDDQYALQPYRNNNPTTGQHGQILGELPEFPTMFDLGTAGDQAYHANTCMYPGLEISTLGYGQGYTNFNAPLPSDATSLDLYGSTPQFWQFGSDSSAFPDPSQQLTLSSFDPGPFQDGTGYNITQMDHYADATPSFGSSSRHVEGSWPDTFGHAYQMSTLGVSPYQDIGEQAFTYSSSASLIALTLAC